MCKFTLQNWFICDLLVLSSPQEGGADSKQTLALEATLYEAVSSASVWLDSAENTLLSGPLLLSDDSEIQLCHLEVRRDPHTDAKI